MKLKRNSLAKVIKHNSEYGMIESSMCLVLRGPFIIDRKYSNCVYSVLLNGNIRNIDHRVLRLVK